MGVDRTKQHLLVSRDEFKNLIQRLRDEVDATLQRKGKEYTGEGACLANLHQQAALENRPAHLIALTFLNKHIIAINNLLTEDDTELLLAGDRGEEKLLSRLVDSIGWVHLLHASLIEHNQEKRTGRKQT